MADKEFVDGLIVKAPRDGAPDFVKGSISIKRVELIGWLSNKDDEWINLDVKESKGGNWYSEVNTYNKQQSAPAAQSELPDDGVPF